MLLDAGCGRLQRLRVELPAEGELQRPVNSALTGFFQDIQRHITEAMPTEVRARIDHLLMVPDANFVSEFERMKADSGKPGVDQFQAEIDKLRAIRAVGVPADPFALVPSKVLQTLKGRATNEIATEMRSHPDEIRYALMGCFLHVRGMEVTDEVIDELDFDFLTEDQSTRADQRDRKSGKEIFSSSFHFNFL